ncbi:kin of IRRE-like protein 1 [Anopheles ziemanni]|uniref:kin of IRRE-like protein 1 n=1 Tax=Anopheles coustani TaxID=139045 RepID=UPI00265AD1EC|nr:kin of IRRE-like protein 1 [Anopheles coustani]XP_058170084.1 kin of IRRE-like protein 1 [Anopheles ziemanni]
MTPPVCVRMFDRQRGGLSSVCGVWSASVPSGAVEDVQQAFRITPNDIEAAQGDEVVLRCEIERLAGRVQWTKDGFALGFGNEIVGFPRFSLNQNHSDGVYNLRITNASYDDAALYQCQVGPAKHNHPIRAQAKLTVVATAKDFRGKYRRT